MGASARTYDALFSRCSHEKKNLNPCIARQGADGHDSFYAFLAVCSFASYCVKVWWQSWDPFFDFWYGSPPRLKFDLRAAYTYDSWQPGKSNPTMICGPKFAKGRISWVQYVYSWRALFGIVAKEDSLLHFARGCCSNGPRIGPVGHWHGNPENPFPPDDRRNGCRDIANRALFSGGGLLFIEEIS